MRAHGLFEGEVAHSHRHEGDGDEFGVERDDVLQGAFELGAVVHAGAHYDLGVHLNASL